MNVFGSLTTFASEDTTGIGALGLDWKAMLLQAGTFILLYFIFKKYVLGKVVKTLNDRQAKIDESLETAEDIEKQSEESDKNAKEIVSKARKNAGEVIDQANSEAKDIVSKAEETGSKKQEKMVNDAQAKIDSDVVAAKEELKGELLTLVASATETVLDEKIDADKDQELIKKALEDSA